LGADRSTHVLKRAQQLHHQSPGTLMAMDVLAMGFKDESFENCIAMDVFHHIRDADVDAMLREIKRVLKIGGHFLVTDPIKVPFFKDPASKLLQWLDRGDCFRDIPELRAFLSRHFEIEEHKTARSGISKWQIYHLRKR
jgi:ubiquinone/menaquinone biosynthesis C-methylase UbiE